MKAILIIAGLIVATTGAIAAMATETSPPINIIFSGDNATCAAWTQYAGNPPVRQHYEMWARGFVSGYNYAHPSGQVKVGAFPSGDELYQYFDQYCRDYPQDSFVAAVIQLVEQLASPALPHKAAPVRKPPAKAATPAK